MALPRSLAAAVFLTLLFTHLTTALQTISGSPCQSICSAAGSLGEDAVCLDGEYKTTAGGRGFESCMDCLLNSTAVDTGKNETDVEWGLFALRYTLSTCMFGKPEEKVSISSPCQVTCAPLNGSIGYQISNDTQDANPKPDYCNVDQFDDTTINNCAFCYSFIPQQLFTANFLQALHIQCRDPPDQGKPFFPDAQAIFNETLISGPSPPKSGNGNGSGLHGTDLALAIALPIVGGIILISGTCWCCFLFTRRRRRNMAATGRMTRVHDAYAEQHTPISGRKMWEDDDHIQEMYQMHAAPSSKHRNTPGADQGRWSQHFPPGTAIGAEDGTPLRNSFQPDREDVGPGRDQYQDPDLHEQYFGDGHADGGHTPRSGDHNWNESR